jgi:phosphate uptake regulator
MLKELLAAWRGRDSLSQMFNEFDQMLEHNHWMFQQAVEVFFSRKAWETVQDPLYARDKQVNQLEQAIRAQIVKHLTINPDTHLAACLMLMSVVKDAERIGDYCKNVFEVGKFYTHEFTDRRYVDRLEAVRRRVETNFVDTRKAFAESDVDRARGVMKAHGEIGKECEAVVRQLLHDQQSIPTDEAVAYSLLTRHLKRIGAHLSNIATAVIAPVHRLDYMDEPQAGEQE